MVQQIVVDNLFLKRLSKRVKKKLNSVIFLKFSTSEKSFGYWVAGWWFSACALRLVDKQKTEKHLPLCHGFAWWWGCCFSVFWRLDIAFLPFADQDRVGATAVYRPYIPVGYSGYADVRMDWLWPLYRCPLVYPLPIS